MKWINTRDEHPLFYKPLLGHWKYWKDGNVEIEEELSIFYCTYGSSNKIFYNREVKNRYLSGAIPPIEWSEFEIPENYDFCYKKEDIQKLEDIRPDLNWKEVSKSIKYLNY